jgi:hypothetical protein
MSGIYLRRGRWFRLYLLVATLGLVLSGGFHEARVFAANVGYRAFSYSASSVSAPTGQKPQSKLWHNDGYWWGSMFSRTADAFNIYRFDMTAQSWTDTGSQIDERNSASADMLWDGTHLYAMTAGRTTNAADSARLLRYSYNNSTRTYSLDAGFPLTIVSGGMEAIVFDKDTTGILWATYTRNNQVYVLHSTADDLTWTTPYILPATGASNLNSDDISAVVAFDNNIGVMWSNQTDSTMYFAIHDDGTSDTQWTMNPALQGPKYADDHINLKSLQADPSGKVYAAVKTGLEDLSSSPQNAPQILLLTLDQQGSWQRRTVGVIQDNHTRPIVVIDSQNRQVYVFMTVQYGTQTSGAIYYKSSSLDQLSFPSGPGTPIIENSTDTHVNNATSTKQTVNSSTGLLVVGGDDTSKYYLYNTLSLGSGGDITPPDTTIDSGPSGTGNGANATFSFSATEANSTFQCSLDGAAYSGCTSPQQYTNLASGSHTFNVRATDPAGNTDPSPATRNWSVGGLTNATFFAEADGHVKEASPTTNYGALIVLESDKSPNTESYLRFTVSGAPGPAQSAKLRLYVTNGTTNGPAVYATATTWNETQLIWNNRPAPLGSPSDDKGAITANSWVEFDVTPLVTGNGTYSFILKPTSSDGTDFSSREANSNKPELVITFATP